MMTVRAFAAIACLAASTLTSAADPAPGRASPLVVSDAWARPTAPGMSMGAAYFVVRNDGAVADSLVAASTPAAARVEFHQTTVVDGMMRMRPLREIGIPAKGRVAVSPGGIHLMLVDLAGPLVAGRSVPLTLEFRRAGKVQVSLAVSARSE